jgi:TQXA domain-containing protein
MNHYTSSFAGMASDDPTIRDAVLLVVHNGYPENAGELQGELTDGQFRAVTQAAVWHFTDGTTMDEAAAELGRFNTAFQWTSEMTVAYNKLVTGDDLDAVPDGYSLDLYITNATDAEGMGVQSLLAAYGTTVPSTEKTSVRVTKRWYGDPAESVTVRLFRNGTDTGRFIRLTAANDWSGTFADLDAADADGNAYAYTVKEDPVDGYLALEPTGDASGGFTLANVQTTDIAVRKKWQGKAGDEAEVSLLADGAVIDTFTLTDGCDWQHTFSDLPAYDPKTGRKIVYTVSETPADGYATEISGNASDGFTITNTLVPEAKVETTPKTGDALTAGGIVAAMASFGIAGCVIGSVIKRRHQP